MKHIGLISQDSERPATADSLLAKAAFIQNIQQAIKAVSMAMELTNKE